MLQSLDKSSGVVPSSKTTPKYQVNWPTTNMDTEGLNTYIITSIVIFLDCYTSSTINWLVGWAIPSKVHREKIKYFCAKWEGGRGRNHNNLTNLIYMDTLWREYSSNSYSEATLTGPPTS